MTFSTRFSIVVPTFNSESTLPNALNSLRRAKEGMDVEVIVVDGVSADATLDVVRKYSDLVTTVISEPDSGIYDAINKGLLKTQGDLICVLGSDDALVDESLPLIAKAWEDARYPEIVAGRALMVSPDGECEYRADEDYDEGALLSGIPFCHNAMFVTPEAYDKVGLYDLTYKICADAQWVHRAIRAGCKCVRIDQPVVRFSLGGTSSREAERIMQETYSVISRNFEGMGVGDAELLFRAIRGWSDGSDVHEVLSRFSSRPDILFSASMAFLGRARRQNIRVQDSKSSVAYSWRNIVRRLFDVFV
ncbi:MAG TPA: glycosyltransferase family 2 protein [Rhodocyclaceae bacterium]|nr:glycosyltransferase family 2 protein [Rhodocyclaceae bacterium]